tara:strand:- start:1040 stop:1690 length:651 start_codon:yes stop_codon:yes gene_type:complete
VRELSARGLIARFFGELTSLERPLLRTLRGVLSRPGVVASDYVRGQRVRYTNPIKWALLSTGLAFLVGRVIGSEGPVRLDVDPSTEMPGWARPIFEFLASNAAPLFVLLLLPLLAMTMRLSFRGTGRKFAEELVLVLYAYGAASLVQVAYAPLALFGAPANLGGPLPLIWTAWAAVAFHAKRRAVTSVLLTLLAHALWIGVLGALAGVALLVNSWF